MEGHDMEAEMRKLRSVYDGVRKSLNKAIEAKDRKSIVANNIRITLISEISKELFGKEPYEL